DAAATADHVAVAHTAETGPLGATVGVGLHKQLLRYQLGGAIQVDGPRGFVSAQGQYFFDGAIQGRVDDVARAIDVGRHGFDGVVFAGWHLLHGSRVDHNIDTVKGALETIEVAHVPDEVPQAPVIVATNTH